MFRPIKNKKIFLVIAVVAVVFGLLLVWNPFRSSTSDESLITIYIRDTAKFDRDCEATKAIEINRGTSTDPVDRAVRGLIETDLSELTESFERVTIVGREARLYFGNEALLYLNGPACLQQSYKAPLERTLREFDQIERVEYYIEGEKFVEWDA